MKELAVHGVHKSFGELHVLDSVELTIPAGSFTAILGSSGSGKTTLLRIVAGFERLDAGEVLLGGEVVDDGRHVFVPSEHRRIGYVPQEGALFPHLSVGRNVAFGLRRGPNRRARVLELLEMVGLSGLHRRYPHQLSGGQQQRVALARALATDPEIVLLDEPFSSLDASLRASVRADVHDVLRLARTTAVLVTHDQDEALSCADSVAVLHDGVILQVGAPRSVYSTPADPWTAAFLGTANLLPGVSERATAGGVRVRTALGWHVLRDPAQAAGATRLSVLIRPEQITLSYIEPGSVIPRQESEDAVTGKVTDIRYHGHDVLVTVDVAGSGPVQARVPGSEPPSSGDEVALVVGDPVIAWPAAERAETDASVARQ